MSSERNRSMPDDLRALGLTVAVHNDYRLNDVPHTFWLMTLPNEDGTALAFKGEGVNDADALDQIRAQVKGFFNLERPSPQAMVSNLPGNRVRVNIDGQVYDFDFVQACDLSENIAAALPEIRWGEGNGPHPSEVVLAQSHPGSRRAAVRPVDGGIALRAVECDGQPAGGSIFLRGGAVDALIAALNAAHLQQGDALLVDLTAAGATRFAPANLTARRCSPTHLQLLDEGVVTADWWPSTGKARAAGPTTGVTAPFKIFTVDALVEWLKGL